MTKVSGQDTAFEDLGDMNFECSSMGHPADELFVLGLREDVMNLLGKRHFLNLRRGFVSSIWRDLREVSVTVVHDTPTSLETLNCHGHGRKVRVARQSVVGRRLGEGRHGSFPCGHDNEWRQSFHWEALLGRVFECDRGAETRGVGL